MIYAIGNSHAHFFTNSHPAEHKGTNPDQHFTSYSLGPTIAYNYYEHHLPKLKQLISQINIQPKDHILLVIGEVDCRWHLPKQAATQNRPINDIIQECVQRYTRVYTHLKQHNYNLISWGGHPSTTTDHNDDPQSPVYGDCKTRNQITLEWDHQLSQQAQKLNIPHISINQHLIDQNGLTKMEYYIDYCHLNSEKLLPHVKQLFVQTGLIKI